MLQSALAFALRSARLERHRLGLSEDQRLAIAADTIKELRKTGWAFLDDVVTPQPGLTSPQVKSGWENTEVRELDAARELVEQHVSALRMIREQVETLAPPGSLPPGMQAGLNPIETAEAVNAVIRKLAYPLPEPDQDKG